MNTKSRELLRLSAVVIAAALLGLVGCGGNTASAAAPTALPGDPTPAAASASGSDSASGSSPGSWQPAPMALAQFHESAATGQNGALIDISAVNEGYAAAAATSEKALKLQVVFGETKYNYNLPGDGTPIIVPLQSGSGSYRVRVMQNTSGDKYAEIASAEAQAELSTGLEPFLRPSVMVNYNTDSACVKKAAELTASAADELGAVSAVYDYIQKNIKYDKAKADQLSTVTGYLPDPDETLSSGTGLCFDYAALAAAMLRSQGIPAKVITGYVQPNDLYHAWNMIWLSESGWITVEIKAPANEWERIDLTFAAGGTDSKYIGDGSNYTDRYTY